MNSYLFYLLELFLYSAGLWITANDLQSLCGIHTQVTCQEEEDALFLWRHHSGGKDQKSLILSEYLDN